MVMEHQKSKIPTFRKIFMQMIRHYAFQVHIYPSLEERYNSLTIASLRKLSEAKSSNCPKQSKDIFSYCNSSGCLYLFRARVAFQLNIF